MASRYGFETEQERESTKKRDEQTESAQREKRKQISDATAQRIGQAIRDSLAEYFRSMGLSTVDATGAEQVALFKEETGIKEHTWTAGSRKKTGTHTEYRADGVHVLDEHTAYTITVSLAVNRDGLPLLYIRDYATSKLVGGMPVAASKFLLEIPSQLKAILENNTGIRQVRLSEYLAALDN
ncbi:MAG: hypothetical protein ACM3S0_10740 [Acidobacteriota bacterium]